MSGDEQMTNLKEEVVARSYEGSVKALIGLGKTLTRTLSPRKPKSAAKPPKFRLERSTSAIAQASYDAEIAKKVEQAAAPKPAMKRLEKLSKFRFRSGHLDFDASSIRV